LRQIARCANSELPAAFEKALEQAKELTKEVERLWSERLADLVKSTAPVDVGSSKVGIHVGPVPKELVSVFAGMLAEAMGGAGVVLSDTQIAIRAKTLDAGALLRRLQGHFGGKGGGSPQAANGRLDQPVSAEELKAFLTA
jgi:alanyl-tRNA synthetase